MDAFFVRFIEYANSKTRIILSLGIDVLILRLQFAKF